MATVKTIDVAVRANIENWDANLKKGAASLESFSAKTNKIAAEMGKATQMFQLGAISQKEYSATIQRAERDLNAVEAGFNGMTAAVQRADGIMRTLENSTERYESELRELGQLLKIGALNQDKYNLAVQRTTAAYHATIPMARLAHDKFSGLSSTVVSGLPGANQFSGVLMGFGPAGLAAAAGLASVATATGLAAKGFRVAADMVGSAMERIDTVAKTAERLGIVVGEFQKLEYAANLANVSSEELASGIQKMMKNISAAADGSKQSQVAFRQLGLDINRLSEMSPDKAFLTIADAIDKLQNPFDKMRLTMEIFGKGAAGFINAFEGGREAIEGWMREAEKLRIPVTEKEAKLIDAARDATERFEKSLQGLGNTLAVKVAPPLSEVMEDITSFIAEPKKTLFDGVRDNLGKLGAAAGLSAITGNKIAFGENIASVYADSVQRGVEEAQKKLDSQSEATAGKAIIPKSALDAESKNIDDYQKALAQADKQTHDNVMKWQEERRNAVDKLTQWQQQANKELQPALSAQEEIAAKVQEITKLYDKQAITLAERNRLMQTAVQLSERESQKAMEKKQERMRDAQMEMMRFQERELTDFISEKNRKGEPPAAIERNTAQAFSAFQKNMDNTRRSDETKIAREQLDHIARIRRMLEKERVVLKMADL